jgi:hypothetical protein
MTVREPAGLTMPSNEMRRVARRANDDRDQVAVMARVLLRHHSNIHRSVHVTDGSGTTFRARGVDVVRASIELPDERRVERFTTTAT